MEHTISSANAQAMNLDSFLAHAIRLEQEAQQIYRKSAEIVDPSKNPDAVAFFQEMSGYASLHLKDIRKRAEGLDIDESHPRQYLWGNNPAPESLSPAPCIDDIIDLDSAMTMALDAERRAAEFYENISQSSLDMEVTELAKEFAAEERHHVLALERFMGLKPY